MPRACTSSLLALLVVLAACPSGREVPSETRMVQVPGGTFTLGPSTPDGTPPACGGAASTEIERCDSGTQLSDPLQWIDGITWVPAATATVASFTIDEHEVTNLQYAHCVDLGSCSPPVSEEVGGLRYYGNSEHDRSPVVWVTHAQAMEFCASVDKQLPSEAQWERAARYAAGGTPRTYPWPGDDPSTCTRGSARYLLAKGCGDGPAPVDYSEADKTDLGIRNMASNVSEWVLDGWNRYAYCENRQSYDEACQLQGKSCAACTTDGARCAKACDADRLAVCRAGSYALFLGSGSEWVVRGGSWNHGICYNRLYVRRKGSSAAQEVGFRCVK